MKKRILALLMALALAFVFVGCGDDASKKKDKEEEKIEEKAKEKDKEEEKEAKKADKKDDEEEIIEVLEGLYDSTQKMDVEGMKKYLDPDSKKYEKIETSFSDTFNFEALSPSMVIFPTLNSITS
ncbi:MAG: hypothetical protein IJZ81_03385 [Clostridia bacterium]|nr:hypothetical protein [Clostridia bacterium]